MKFTKQKEAFEAYFNHDKKTVTKFLWLPVTTRNQEMFNTVYDMYEDKHQLAINLMCMWLCREQGVTWVHHQRNSGLIIPDEFAPVLDQMFESTKSFIKTT